MISTKCNYEIHDKNFLIIIFAFKQWRYYFKKTKKQIFVFIEKIMNDCHCIACNIIEITYKSKYNLIAQIFLIIIDFDTFRLIDQSEILILFVFIF